MKKRLTANDRITAAIEVMLIRDYCDAGRQSDRDIRGCAYSLALSLKSDPKTHRQQIENSICELAALETSMNAYILCHWYSVQTILGISPISELAHKAHDVERGHGSTKWVEFVRERQEALREPEQVAA